MPDARKMTSFRGPLRGRVFMPDRRPLTMNSAASRTCAPCRTWFLPVRSPRPVGLQADLPCPRCKPTPASHRPEMEIPPRSPQGPPFMCSQACRARRLLHASPCPPCGFSLPGARSAGAAGLWLLPPRNRSRHAARTLTLTQAASHSARLSKVRFRRLATALGSRAKRPAAQEP